VSPDRKGGATFAQEPASPPRACLDKATMNDHPPQEAFANAVHSLLRDTALRWNRQGRHWPLVWGLMTANMLWHRLWRRVHLRRIIRRIKGLRGRQDPASLFDFASDPFGGALDPSQVKSEILALLGLLTERPPRRVLEIGTGTGGTTLLVCHAAAPDALIITLDLPGGPFGGGYPEWQVPLLRAMPLPTQRLRLVRADSHSPAVLARVRRLLGGEPLDFLFIDGDHRYEGVKRDFTAYGSMVRPGGLIALHDISPSPFGFRCSGDVPRFWQEIRTQERTREFIAEPGQGYGIGVVFR